MIDTIEMIETEGVVRPSSQAYQACQGCSVWEENQKILAENTGLRERVKELETENGKLKRRLAHYEDTNNNTHTKPLRRRRRRKKTLLRFPGRPRGYPGTTRLRPKPDIVVQTDSLDECPECGNHIGEPVYTKHRVIEELPDLEKVKVVDYEEDHYLCPGCESEIVTRHPNCPPTGRFGKNIYVQTTLLKFEERLPLRKIRAVLKRQGLDVTGTTVLELLWRTSKWLRPEYKKILAQVRASQVVYTDQTGIRVDGEQNWIWDFVTDTEILYTIRNTKGRRVLDETLGKHWEGLLVCDGHRSHHSYTKNIQRCWVHILTEADKIVEEEQEEQEGRAKQENKGEEEEGEEEEDGGGDEGEAEAEALGRSLHGIYDRLKEALEKKPPPYERRRLVRNGRKTLRYWINKDYRDVKVSRFVEKIRRAYPYLFTAVTHPGVDLHNNRSERGLRELVVQRKIIGTLRNEKGTYIYETLATLLATWKHRGLDPLQALSTALTQTWKTQTNQPQCNT